MGPLPSVGPAPAGAWASINWIAVPGGHSPEVSSQGANYYPYAALQAWSKGYVEFIWDPAKAIVVPWVSADGLHWMAGSALDANGWVTEMENGKIPIPRSETGGCSFVISDFAEGPTSLVVRGQLACAGGCGDPWMSKARVWTSTDGLTWTKLNVYEATGGGSFSAISGSTNGFMAVDTKSAKRTIWLSPDGANWSQGAFPDEAGTYFPVQPVAFAKGQVLAGTVVIRAGDEFQLPEDFCGGLVTADEDAIPALYRGTIWGSSDGVTWARVNLSGTSVVAGYLWMTVSRVDEHTLLAHQSTPDKDAWWISTDGRIWKPLAEAPGDFILGGRDRGLVYARRWSDESAGWSHDFFMYDDKLQPVSIAHGGDEPWWIEDVGAGTFQMVLGPTGVLLTQDGSRFWLGVPSAKDQL
jgi:hypothetical protein